MLRDVWGFSRSGMAGRLSGAVPFVGDAMCNEQDLRGLRALLLMERKKDRSVQ